MQVDIYYNYTLKATKIKIPIQYASCYVNPNLAPGYPSEYLLFKQEPRASSTDRLAKFCIKIFLWW